MELLYFIIASGSLGATFFVILLLSGKKKDAVKTEPKVVEEPERPGYLLEGYGPPERYDGTGLCSILLTAYRSLQEQRAAGFRNWIPTCIEKLQKGFEVSPETALFALRWTRDELNGLNGRRYDLKELGRAILALEVETGEWG